jgi:SOS-response transcriptional repressor LexA
MIGNSYTGTPQHTEKHHTVPTRLKGFRLSNMTLTSQDWETLIKAIDVSMIQELIFDGTNFSQEQLDLLIDCMASTGKQSVSLKSLDIDGTDLALNGDNAALRERIQKAAPRVRIQGLPLL